MWESEDSSQSPITDPQTNLYSFWPASEMPGVP